MTKSVSANEAKNRLGYLLGYVSDQDGEVIVESRGKPKAVIMSIAAYEEVQVLREQERRRKALDTLRALRTEVRAANRDTPEKDAAEIADHVSHELVDNLAAGGEIRFERDQS